MVTPRFSADMTVRDARDAYLAENGFTVAAYEDTWTDGSFFGIRMKIPNTKHHRWAIMMHDLHHVAMGYGTDLLGEGEISVVEVRSLWSLGPYVGSIVFVGALMGAFFAPRRALAAWRDSRESRSLHDLYPTTNEAAYEDMLKLTVGELRAKLRLSRDGIVARGPRKLHVYAPSGGST